MTASLPNTRLLVVLGALVAPVGVLLIARPLMREMTALPRQSRPPPRPSPQPRRRPQPLPLPVCSFSPACPPPWRASPRYEKVVVVSLYAAKAPGDRKALTHARVGAKQVGAGFVALNLYDERKANSMVKFLGTTDSPAVLVVRRPGTVVTRIEGFVDAEIVSQAAQNAAGGKKPKPKSPKS